MKAPPSASARPGVLIAHDAGLLGSVVSAIGCPACFPALASLGAAAGLGFLSPYEGLFIRILLPAFALLALAAHLLGWYLQRRWRPAALGALGPLLVLAAVFVMRATGERTGWLLYPGLILMAAFGLWQLRASRPRACARRPSA